MNRQEGGIVDMADEAELLGELDGLWQAATFLQCGDAEKAEALLVRAVASAAGRYAVHPPGRSDAPLEPHLIRVFLEGVPSERMNTALRSGVSQDRPAGAAGRAIPPSGHTGDSDRHIPMAALHAAAASVPPWARAAIWLVLIRRWSYKDTAAVMGLDRGDVRALLGFQDVFAATALEEPAESSMRRRTAE